MESKLCICDLWFCCLILSLLIQWIDRGEISAEGKTIKTKENPITVLFLSFGMNPLFLYVLSEFLAIVFGTYGIKDDLLGLIRNVISDEYLVSLTYALSFVAIHAAMGIWMYQKKIFIKL